MCENLIAIGRESRQLFSLIRETKRVIENSGELCGQKIPRDYLESLLKNRLVLITILYNIRCLHNHTMLAFRGCRQFVSYSRSENNYKNNLLNFMDK